MEVVTLSKCMCQTLETVGMGNSDEKNFYLIKQSCVNSHKSFFTLLDLLSLFYGLRFTFLVLF